MILSCCYYIGAFWPKIQGRLLWPRTGLKNFLRNQSDVLLPRAGHVILSSKVIHFVARLGMVSSNNRCLNNNRRDEQNHRHACALAATPTAATPEEMHRKLLGRGGVGWVQKVENITPPRESKHSSRLVDLSPFFSQNDGESERKNKVVKRSKVFPLLASFSLLRGKISIT